MAEQIGVSVGDGILLCSKEQWIGVITCELEWPLGTGSEWKEQKNIVHRGRYTVVQSSIMDFCTNSNTMIQDNSEGLMKKNDIHM